MAMLREPETTARTKPVPTKSKRAPPKRAVESMQDRLKEVVHNKKLESLLQIGSVKQTPAKSQNLQEIINSKLSKINEDNMEDIFAASSGSFASKATY